MTSVQPTNGKKISVQINRLRQIGNELGNIRQQHLRDEHPDELRLRSDIKEVCEEIKNLIEGDQFFSQDEYFIALPSGYESMVSSVRNAYETSDSLLRDEIVFQLNLQTHSGFKHWLSMRPHEFKTEIEYLLNQKRERK